MKLLRMDLSGVENRLWLEETFQCPPAWSEKRWSDAQLTLVGRMRTDLVE